MNALSRTFAALAATAGMVLIASAQRPAADPPAASAPAASRPADTAMRILPTGDEGVPVIAPSLIRASEPARSPNLIGEGQMLIDHPGSLARDPTGKWWTVKHPRTGVLHLLPCELLGTVENIYAERPSAKFALSGRVYRYYDDYFLLLRRATEVGERPVRPPPPRPRTKPAVTSRPAASAPAATTRPTTPGASAADVARLLARPPSKPIVPVAAPIVPWAEGPSVPPAAEPVKPGPGRIIIHRLTRLRPPDSKGGWFKLAFESDNTLREPPMRVLPNLQLERLEPATGVLFYVSGEIYAYQGTNYVLLRAISRRRPMDRF